MLRTRENCEKLYRLSRLALIGMVVMSVLNIGLLALNVIADFVTTAAIPEVIALLGMMLYALDAPLYIVILCGIFIFLLLFAYFSCWAFSGKRGGWLTAAVILYGIDYVVRLYLLVCDIYAAESLILIVARMLFPTAVLVLLVLGRIARRKLQELL